MWWGLNQFQPIRKGFSRLRQPERRKKWVKKIKGRTKKEKKEINYGSQIGFLL